MKIRLLILLLITAFLLFFHLNRRPLLSSGEARAAEIAVEMISNNNFIVPSLNGDVMLTKPVLFHWLIVLDYKIFGISEFAVRFPCVVSGIMVILLVYLLGKQFWDYKKGFAAGLILLTSPLFFRAERCGRIDGLLLGLIVSALYCFWQGYQKPRRRKLWFLGWFAFMGIGFLAKGPVGIVIPLFTVILFLIFIRKSYLLKELNWKWGIPIFLVIASPWYIAIRFLVPHTNSSFFFLHQNVTWLEGKGRWYMYFEYIPYLIAGFFPWSLFLPLAITHTWKDFKFNKDERLAFLWIWALVVFIMFSLLGKNISRYILPMYPALALLTAGISLNKKGAGRILSISLGIISALWGIILLGANLINPVLNLLSGRIDPIIPSILRPYLLSHRLELNIIGVLLIVFALICIKQKSLNFRFKGLIAILAVSWIMFIMRWIPIETEYYSPKPFCNAVKKEIPADTPLYAYKSFHKQVRFYLRKHINIINTETDFLNLLNSEKQVYCYMWEKIYKKLPSDIKKKIKIIAKGYKVSNHKVILITNT